jgi:hypothetical protein
VNSRNKGKVGEREARDAIREHLGLADAKRSAQVSGKEASDVLTEAPIHWEVKRRKKIAALSFLEQAERDAEASTTAEDKVPAVVMREDGSTEWVLMLRLADFRRLSNAVTGARWREAVENMK